jgi:FdhE protein
MAQDLIPHIERLIRQRPASRTALTAFQGLAVLMGQTAPSDRPVHIEKRMRDIQQVKGFPLFSREDLPLDLDAGADLLKKFLSHLGASDRNDSTGLTTALKKAETVAEWSSELFRAILRQDEKALTRMAREVDLDPYVLVFLGKTALRPSLEQFRKTASGELDKSGWDEGYCPLCGSEPAMACFENCGRRYLYCELCGEKWPFPRVKCPFCGMVEQDRLGYFETEEEEGLRVYFCRECRRYLKTIDKRVFEEPAPLELEGLATLHLDLLAQEHGFK